MISSSKGFGEDFHYQVHSTTKKDGDTLEWHDVCACIRPELTEEDSLCAAWNLVREIAEWLSVEAPSSKIENFRIIVGWSKAVRELQGQIFKIWQPNSHLDLILDCVSHEDYAKRSGDNCVPMPGWQKDVFAQ